LLARPDVQRYIDEQVASGSFNRPELEAVFANVELKPNIIAILDKPATSRPWYQFRGSFYNERLLKNGVAFWQQHAATLQRAEQVYGVPPEMVVAILGIETNYGRNTGSFRLADALTTIAFNYPRRAEYFRRADRIPQAVQGRGHRPADAERLLCRGDGLAAVHAVQLPQMGGGF
jgi:membrane-bound lytic murein transglycosylase B